ncbi:MAG: hypothetical protein Q8O91_05635 [Candidatus Aminicenantes bacterium]|nr:hypothetical protein [Candidatus Aminicenantes bacterium]
MNIIEAIEDRHLFRPLFKDPETWAAWRVFLKAVFALPMDQGELEEYRRWTARQKAPGQAFNEVFAIVGRRGGKSFMAAVIACFMALFKDWGPYLAPGETAWIMVISTDRAQARNILGYIKGILQTSHMFRGMIEKDLTWEINLNNQVSIRVATCDFRTLRGYTVVAAICDELAFWRSEGAQPAQEILTALRPSLATVPGSLLLGISSPYSKTGPLYEAFRERYGQDDEEVLIWKAPTKAMNPTIKDSVIDRAMKSDYAAGKAEWQAEFREDLETFLTTEMIEAVIIPGRLELPTIEGARYRAFIDPSGGRADSFTMAIAHKEKNGGRVVLDRIEERRPPLAPQDVAKEFSEIMKSYGVRRCQGDRYAGEFTVKAFADAGITYEASKLSKSEIYLEFEPILAQGQVELLDYKKMFNELRGLERRTRSGGKDLVDHGPGCHDDVANAAAGAVVLAADSGAVHIWVGGGAGPKKEDPEKAEDKRTEEEKTEERRREIRNQLGSETVFLTSVGENLFHR